MQSTTTTESYSFDPVGNRLSSLGVSPYSVNTSNELTSIPGTTYTYDNNGNTLTKVTSSGTTTYGWDFENRLTSVTLPATGGTLAFKYDGLGRRVQKAFTQGSTTTTTNYLYDVSNAVADVDQSGNVLARYAATQNIDEPMAELRSTTTSYYSQDGLDSVTSLTTSAGALGNTYTYDSFGKLTSSNGSIGNRFQYTAREFDQETGLYYYRARYYDPNVGRFLGEDPIKGITGGINFYEYVTNSPVGLTDPTGLCPCAAAPLLRLVPISDCSHPGYRRIVYELQGPGAQNWWVTEQQNPTWWVPATGGSSQGRSTGNENDDAGGFDDTIFGWATGNSLQNFTISPQDPRKFPKTPSCPVNVQLPSGSNGKGQDYGTLGIWHGGPSGSSYINGNSTGMGIV
jgi:RHS repeat-associated protein